MPKAVRRYPSKCLTCGKRFVGWRKLSKYCSRQCSGKGKVRRPLGRPEKPVTGKSRGAGIAVSVQDLIRTYSPKTRERLNKYPEIMATKREGKSTLEIERTMGVSDSTVSYYTMKAFYPRMYRELKACRWLPLKKSKGLDFLVEYVRDHGHIHKSLNTAKLWSADRFELKRINERLKRVFRRRFKIRKDRRIYVIYTDSLTARALYVAGVPVGMRSL